MSDDEMLYPPSVDKYIQNQLSECRMEFAKIGKKRLKKMIEMIPSLYRQAKMEVPEDLNLEWIKRQRSHRNKKRTTNRPIPEYVIKCIDRYWERDKKWKELSDDVKKRIVEEVKKLYEENNDEPNNEVTPQWIKVIRKQKKNNMRQKQKRQTDPIYNEEQNVKRAKRENERIQVEFEGDRKAFQSHLNERAKERKEKNPEIYEKKLKKRRDKYASDPDYREKVAAQTRANNAKLQIEIKTVLAKDPTKRTVEDVKKLDRKALCLMKFRRRGARRRHAKNDAKWVHKGQYVAMYKTVVYPTYSTLYMSGFNTPEEGLLT